MEPSPCGSAEPQAPLLVSAKSAWPEDPPGTGPDQMTGVPDLPAVILPPRPALESQTAPSYVSPPVFLPVGPSAVGSACSAEGVGRESEARVVGLHTATWGRGCPGPLGCRLMLPPQCPLT